MSDDDGLLLNFAAPLTKAPARRISGKRQPLKARHSLSKTFTAERPDQSKSTSQKIPLVPSTTTEKRKETASIEDFSDPSESLTQLVPSSRRESQAARSTVPPVRKDGYISSLFTGDEASTSRKPFLRTEASEDVKQQPSNAPSAGTPFGSLGLDPLLVSHLRSSKMSIEVPTSIQRNALPFLLSPSNVSSDALLHAQTGSGKTLSYMLPIIQSLLPLCETSWIDRSCLGTLAIILAPTRELAHQIYEVAETLCNLHLTTKEREDEVKKEEEETSLVTRRTRWIVPGLLSGGATRNHEKSRLRKGLALIVATPGRLLDHLRSTASFDVGRLQWLILDEADRLLQLGFEQTLTDIMKAIDGRRRATCEVQRTRMIKELGSQEAQQAQISDEEVIDTFGERWWRRPRRTILCSATLDEGVQVLAGKSLLNTRVIRGDTTDTTVSDQDVQAFKNPKVTSMIAAPAQLKQNYVVAPTKQRLIILVALLRKVIATGQSKVMVFLSCTDSVDFHWAALGGVRMTSPSETQTAVKSDEASLKMDSELLPSTSVFKLHGSLSQRDRTASLKLFSQCKQSAVLLCTSVASRGLDLDVSCVVQLDPPNEKGVDEYLHRIGRTARVGEEGESWLLLLPSEEGCIPFYESQMGSKVRRIELQRSNEILQGGFSGQNLYQAQSRATEVQLAFERWVLQSEEHATMARKAYLSHLRAYTTHPPSERQYFSIANLQLGHLAKAFALREAPGVIRSKVKSSTKTSLKAEQVIGTEQPGKKRKRIDINLDDAKTEGESEDEFSRKNLDFTRNKESEAKMYAKVREMGKLNRKGGVLGAYGADEYQIG